MIFNRKLPLALMPGMNDHQYHYQDLNNLQDLDVPSPITNIGIKFPRLVQCVILT